MILFFTGIIILYIISFCISCILLLYRCYCQGNAWCTKETSSRTIYSYSHARIFKTHAKNFWIKWNFPNSVGAIDEKHIRIVSLIKAAFFFLITKHIFPLSCWVWWHKLYVYCCRYRVIRNRRWQWDAKSNMGKLVKCENIFPADNYFRI